MKENQPLAVIGLPNSQDTVRRVFSNLEPCKILDVPAGTGAFAEILHKAGWDVHCADIDKGNVEYKKVPFTQVNLNTRLPFDEESFDMVVCINGLHRIYNVSGAISEFNRILNVNNYASIKSRIRFLFFGSVDAGLNAGSTQQTINDPDANFRHCLMLPQIANSLYKHNFEIVNSFAAAVTWKHRFLWPFSLLIKLVNCFIPAARSNNQYLDITASNSMNPGGDYLLIEAKKV